MEDRLSGFSKVLWNMYHMFSEAAYLLIDPYGKYNLGLQFILRMEIFSRDLNFACQTLLGKIERDWSLSMGIGPIILEQERSLKTASLSLAYQTWFLTVRVALRVLRGQDYTLQFCSFLLSLAFIIISLLCWLKSFHPSTNCHCSEPTDH